MIFFLKKDINKNMEKCALLILGIFVFLSACTGGYHSDGQYLYVAKGDTLYTLAKRNNIPMRALIKENNLISPYQLYAGQKLRIPQPKEHIVQKGETLYSISKKYGMSVNALSKMNALQEPYTIHLGQKLLISETQNTPKTTAVKQIPQKTPAYTPRTTASIPSSQSKKRFAWPVKGQIVSDYGSHGKSQNDGINILAKKGSPVLAADGGTVGYAGSELKGYGNLVLLKHDGGWMTAYAHNDKLLVKKGQKIKKGDKIALVGQTGNVKTPQLHFEVRYKTKVVNPKNYLQ